MARQLHKRFPDELIKSLFERYLSKEIEINYLLEIVGVKRRRFFKLLKEYWKDPDGMICTCKVRVKPRQAVAQILFPRQFLHHNRLPEIYHINPWVLGEK